MLLLTFPHLKTSHGPVRNRLHAAGAGTQAILAAWENVVLQQIRPEDDDEGQFGS